MKHTQIKWIVTMQPLLAVYNLELQKMGIDSIPNEEAEANAKLIAAAPELLEALMFAVESMSMHDTMFNKALMVAKNAIKKATS